MPLMTDDKETYQAAAVAVKGEWLYFINMDRARSSKVASRSCEPATPLVGPWEKCGEIRGAMDPCLFWDEDDRLYVYCGLGSPAQVFQLDTQTFTEIPETRRQLMPAIPGPDGLDNGFELGRREFEPNSPLDTGGLKGKFTWKPCQEGSWMTKFKGKYYLQIATPGTVSQWYCDNLLTGSAPNGPFTQADYAPVSFKVGGFKKRRKIPV